MGIRVEIEGGIQETHYVNSENFVPFAVRKESGGDVYVSSSHRNIDGGIQEVGVVIFPNPDQLTIGHYKTNVADPVAIVGRKTVILQRGEALQVVDAHDRHENNTVKIFNPEGDLGVASGPGGRRDPVLV